MPSSAVLLQAAEITKVAAEAASAVTAQARQEGGISALLWLLVIGFGSAAVFFYVKSTKADAAKNDALINQNKTIAGAVKEAEQVVRTESARQQAVDNAHWEGLLAQSRERENDALNRLERINAELRQQDKKSVEVIGAVGNSMNQVAATIQGMQIKLATLEMLFTGRPSPPALPPTVFTPPTP